ncbi:protein of unknown function (plasmid) [Cupriavidus taiwanensis]|nr:protein of unknown function [Cupriavidus taiwanensis]
MQGCLKPVGNCRFPCAGEACEPEDGRGLTKQLRSRFRTDSEVVDVKVRSASIAHHISYTCVKLDFANNTGARLANASCEVHVQIGRS